jgi:hypothetical protein
MQNMYYFKDKVNTNVICLPHFSNNNTNFKYHNDKYNNSFFLYFKKKIDIINLQDYKLFFVKANVIDNYPFFNVVFPVMTDITNKNYINLFSNNFELIKNNNIEQQIIEIKNKKPFIGIHIRSLAQKKAHHPEYLIISTKDRLLNVKQKCDNEYGDYCVFIASDTNPNIELAKSIFKDVYYFENITRIDTDEDIIGTLSDKENYYKLGMDILSECFALSICDKIFVSSSNIIYITSIINPNNYVILITRGTMVGFPTVFSEYFPKSIIS